MRSSRRVGVVALVVLLAGTGLLHAADTVPTTHAADSTNSADREALRKLLPLYEQAAREGKPDLLAPWLDSQFSGVMVTGDDVTSFASLSEYWSKIRALMGEGGSYQVKVNLSDHAMMSDSADLAVAHGTTEDVVVAKGKDYRFEGRWTAVCRKRDGQWKLLRIHASMDPVGNEFVTTFVKRGAVMAGVTAGVGGLVVGWILHVLVARRRKVTAGTGQ